MDSIALQAAEHKHISFAYENIDGLYPDFLHRIDVRAASRGLQGQGQYHLFIWGTYLPCAGTEILQ